MLAQLNACPMKSENYFIGVALQPHRRWDSTGGDAAVEGRICLGGAHQSEDGCISIISLPHGAMNCHSES